MTVLTTLLSTPIPDRSFWMPEQASSAANSVDFVFNVVTWISIFFFVLIVAIMAVFIVKYRRREGHHAQQTVTHHTPLELTWTIIPLALVVVIFYVGMVGYLDLRTAPVDAYEVNVTAQKWTWTFEHRGGCSEVNTLRVPVNRPVRLIMTSEDVLHSAFIPAFRVKQDVVPGRYATLWFQANRPGTYELFCAEYCGTSHSQMVAQVIVYEEDEFEAAITECARWIDGIPDEGLYLAGSQLYNRCVLCHSLDGTERIGPSFLDTHQNWGQPRLMANGSSTVIDENYVRESILVPSAEIVAGYPNSMPPFQGQLREKQLRAMVEFIKRLDEIELDDRGRPVGLSPDEILQRIGIGGEAPPAEGQ